MKRVMYVFVLAVLISLLAAPASAAQEITFGGRPLGWFFSGKTVRDVAEVFGEPIDSGWWDGYYYLFEGPIMVFPDEEEDDYVVALQVNTGSCEINGITLNKSRQELIEILGMPDEEGLMEDAEGDFEYHMRYERPAYLVSISMPTQNDIANLITVWGK